VTSALSRDGEIAEAFRADPTLNEMHKTLIGELPGPVADSGGLRTGFRRKPDSVPMIADSR